MIVDKINAYLTGEGKTIDQAILDEVAFLAQNAFTRQFGPKSEEKRTLRLSSIGKCLRQQAYGVLGFEQKGKEIDSRAKMVFFQGDLVELAIVQLAKVAGCDLVDCGKDQKKVYLDGIEGHPDGVLTHNGEKFLVSVKSMSSYSFSDFEKGIIEGSYIYQENAYLAAEGLDKSVYVALNKDAGVLAEIVITKDGNIVSDIRQRIDYLKHAQKWIADGKVKEEALLPDRPYVPNDKGYYPWNCLYCAFHKTCLPTADKVLVSRSYKLKEMGEKGA